MIDPGFYISKDGFTILAMGYTGEKAMKFKEIYIAEFNRRGEELAKLRDYMIPSTFSEALILAGETMKIIIT